jgi:hypothetical protein
MSADRAEPSTHRAERRLVNVAAWPGRAGWYPPTAPPEPKRLADGFALVLVAAPELGAVPERLGLAGWWLVHQGLILAGGLVCDDELAVRDPARYAALEEWCQRRVLPTAAGYVPWRLVDCSTLGREILRRWGYRARCLVAGIELGHAFALLADWSWTASRPGFSDGWGLGLPGFGVRGTRRDAARWLPDTGMPVALYVAQRGVRGSSLRWGKPRPPFKGEMPAQDGRESRKVRGDEGWGAFEPDGRAYAGRFADLVASAFAFDGIDSDDVIDHADAWGIEPIEPRAVRPDAEGAEHVAELLDASRRLLVALDDEAAEWGIALEDLSSPATVARRTLQRMGVTAPLAKLTTSDEELDAWRATNYGGWVTADIVDRLLPAADLDVRNCYPRLACHLGWWPHVRARRMRRRCVSRRWRDFFARPGREVRAAMRDPATWRRGGCTRMVVRAWGASLPCKDVGEHDRSRDRLVVGPLFAERWDCTWLDLVAAVALDGEARFEILEAVELVPEGHQAGLRPVEVCGIRLDPDADPILELVRRRDEAKAVGDERRAAMLRVFNNALVYGLFGEFDPTPDGGERPGSWCWPPLSAIVAAAGRCVLALLEADVRDRGSAIVARDTDGGIVLASPEGGEVDLGDGRLDRVLSWAELDELLASWNALAIDGGEFWSVERGTPEAPLQAISWGPKRYALVQHDAYGTVRVVASTEFALGVEPPPTMRARNPDGGHEWATEVARVEAQAAEGGGP